MTIIQSMRTNNMDYLKKAHLDDKINMLVEGLITRTEFVDSLNENEDRITLEFIRLMTTQ